VISHLPPVSTYGKLAAAILNIFSRVGAGLVATAIGLGFLSMGIVSISLPVASGETKVSVIIEQCGAGALPLVDKRKSTTSKTGDTKESTPPTITDTKESTSSRTADTKSAGSPDARAKCTT